MSPAYTDVTKKSHVHGPGDSLIKTGPNPAPKLLSYPIDVTLDSLIINDAPIRDQLAGAVIDGEILETMDYAAGTVTLNVQDSSRTLVHGLLSQWVSADSPVIVTSRAGQRRHRVMPQEWNEIQLVIDGRDYTLVGAVKNGNQFDLTFENRAIHELRRYSTPKVWYRDTYTRAMVVQSMCKEVRGYHIEFYAPELYIPQPITTTKGLPSPRETKSKKLRGFSKGAHFTVKGHRNTSQQKSHAETIIRVGESMHAPYNCLVAALMAAIELSNLNSNTTVGGIQYGGGSGLFAFLSSTDETNDSHAFFKSAIQTAQLLPGSPPETLAYMVENGGRGGAYFFTEAEFKRWTSEAEAILKAWGTSLTGGSVTFTEYNRYAFKRGLDGQRENSWDCAVRLAKEVNWRVFSTDNILWWVDDNDLRYSIPFDTISEATEGIESIDWEIDTGKKLNSVTVTADLARWQAPPGVPIVIEDAGPANGRWLVFEVRRPLFQNVAEITCHLPSPPIAEPAPTTKRVSITGGKLGTSIALSGNAKVDATYAKAVEISKKKYPYVFAGGHTSDFSPHGGPGIGYDCSGYVSACLNAGGMLTSPLASGGFLSWGDSGQGKLMTIWTNPNPGASGHVFIEFKLPPPAGHCQANTSHSSFDGNKQGAELLPWGYNGAADAAGSPGNNFFPRHWPGT